MTDVRRDKSYVNLRSLALDVLLLSEQEGVFSDRLIRDTLDAHAFLPEQERRFFKRLTEGTIERRLTLDYLIDRVSSVPTAKQKPQIREILRMGTFQLRFMDAVPASAAINEAVRLAKKRKFGSLSGFVNGVLRAVSRDDFPLSSIPELSIRYSCPAWITELLEKTWGREKTEKLLRASLGARTLYIRPNRLRTTPGACLSRLEKAGIAASLTSDGRALYLKDGAPVSSLPGFSEGDFSVQDLSSMQVGFLSGGKPGMRVLDCCSAPGGKVCHLAELMDDEGELDAFDISEEKTALIRENTDRLALSSVRTGVWDASEFSPSRENRYDIVLADLPCSGLGVLGRKNEIKYRLKPEDIGALSRLQRDILENACRYVKAGGRLIYSVCTVTKEETKDVRAFLEETPGLVFTKERMFLPDADEAESTDGMYIAVFQKT